MKTISVKQIDILGEKTMSNCGSNIALNLGNIWELETQPFYSPSLIYDYLLGDCAHGYVITNCVPFLWVENLKCLRNRNLSISYINSPLSIKPKEFYKGLIPRCLSCLQAIVCGFYLMVANRNLSIQSSWLFLCLWARAKRNNSLLSFLYDRKYKLF